MASVLHVAVGLAAGRLFARRTGASGRRLRDLRAGGVALAMLPDLDVIAFRFGIPYAAPFGHRGAAHALIVAVAIGAIAAAVAPAGTRRVAGLLAGAVVASHGLLDTLTDGGLGVALLWPFSAERFFAPWRPIPVAPIGIAFLSARGMSVAGFELIWSLPLLAYAFWPERSAVSLGSRGAGARRRRPGPASTSSRGARRGRGAPW
jgi:inner membrane protein